MNLNVPYYAQSSEFSCGPACVLMAMKHFEPAVRIGRELEFEVWRQCNMIGIKGADPYGLSVPLLDAGYEVRLVTQWRKTAKAVPWRRRLAHLRTADADLSFMGMRENKRRALKRGLAVAFKRPLVPDVASEVQNGALPIALVHMGAVHSLNIPHWVVVTDVNDGNVIFNDPYPPKGRKNLSLSHVKFQQILDDIGTRIGLSPSVLFVRSR